ncbi:MAG: iron-containing alcohol dehydrogenase [Candidatus Helarchaeota archaeon]
MSLNTIRVPLIYYGKGSLKELKNVRQNKVFIVTDKTINELYGAKILKFLKKKETLVFDEIKPDPTDEIIIKGSKIALEFKPELIIGIGGGSVMDSAKAIFFLYEREDKTLYDMNPVNFFKLGKKSNLILIPTTSGTGAEHTGAIIVTNTENGQKVALACFELVPSAVIIDPKLTLGMPPTLTASTGIDALVHAFESLINTLSNDYTEAVNLHAIRLLFKYLPLAVDDGANDINDINVREKVHNAASLAGIGLANSAAGIGHSCGHSLGSVFHIQHGKAVGLMLPYIIEFNKPNCEKKYVEILNYLNIDPTNNPTEKLTSIIHDFLKTLNLPTTIKELVEKEEFDKNFNKLVEFAFSDVATGINPRPTTKEDFEKIFKYAYEGKKIDF